MTQLISVIPTLPDPMATERGEIKIPAPVRYAQKRVNYYEYLYQREPTLEGVTTSIIEYLYQRESTLEGVTTSIIEYLYLREPPTLEGVTTSII